MIDSLKKCIADKLRMSHWLLLAMVMYIVAPILAAVGFAQLSTVAWKIGHLTVAAHVGYWVDRNAFKYSRLDITSTPIQEIRRAIIIVGSMLAVSMGM